MTDFETQLKESGFLVFTNKGISMMPLIRQDKDIMVIRRLEKPPQIYDAVLFIRDNGQYILHRVIRKNRDGSYFIRGDNCIAGENIRPEKIIGILCEIKRDGETLKVTDPKYIKYLKTLKLRFLWLVLKTKARQFLLKIYHLIVR